MMKHITGFVLCAVILLFGGCAHTVVQEAPPASQTSSVRAVWIPYMEVESLLTVADPVAAIRECMQECAARGANTVYMHVRANSDAYYASDVFASTAHTAAVLARGIDPLSIAVEEAHRLGLSLHAWVNPYRIGTDVTRARTTDIFSFEGRWYYVPTADSTRTLVLDGVRELVERYGIDGVQFDDYFYPVGAVDATTPAVFEQASFDAYRQAGGALSVADWRRAAVDRLVAAVYAVCHSRTDCVFGISPACDIVQVRESMYADAAKWAQTAGYVDYLCPQLYVGFEHETAPFSSMLEMWSSLARHDDVSLIAGLALYKTGLHEDIYAGSGKQEWAMGGDILSRQLQAVADAAWDGAALYSHLSFQADDTRNSDIVQQEIANLRWTS